MKVLAPWTDEQVAALNRWQRYGFVHEFTCPNEHPGDSSRITSVLWATRDGWICALCDYKQDWAHHYMFEELANPFDSL